MNKDLDDILPSGKPSQRLYNRVMDDIPSAQGKIDSRELEGILPVHNPDDALLARVMADMPASQQQATDAEMLAILPHGQPSKDLYARIVADIPDTIEEDEEDFISSKWLKAGMVALGLNVSISSYAMAESYISNGMTLLSNAMLLSLGG